MPVVSPPPEEYHSPAVQDGHAGDYARLGWLDLEQILLTLDNASGTLSKTATGWITYAEMMNSYAQDTGADPINFENMLKGQIPPTVWSGQAGDEFRKKMGLVGKYFSDAATNAYQTATTLSLLGPYFGNLGDQWKNLQSDWKTTFQLISDLGKKSSYDVDYYKKAFKLPALIESVPDPIKNGDNSEDVGFSLITQLDCYFGFVHVPSTGRRTLQIQSNLDGNATSFPGPSVAVPVDDFNLSWFQDNFSEGYRRQLVAVVQEAGDGCSRARTMIPQAPTRPAVGSAAGADNSGGGGAADSATGFPSDGFGGSSSLPGVDGFGGSSSLPGVDGLGGSSSFPGTATDTGNSGPSSTTPVDYTPPPTSSLPSAPSSPHGSGTLASAGPGFGGATTFAPGVGAGLGSGGGLGTNGLGVGSGPLSSAAAPSAIDGGGAGVAGATGRSGFPLYPMGMGMGMGGNNGERQRQSWLPEDEDVWGAATDAPEGVL